MKEITSLLITTLKMVVNSTVQKKKKIKKNKNATGNTNLFFNLIEAKFGTERKSYLIQ